MKEQLIREIRTDMSGYLTERQMNELHEVLLRHLSRVKVEPAGDEEVRKKNSDYLEMYLAAKRIEGCSEKTIVYYQAVVKKMLIGINKPDSEVTTEDLRLYLAGYQKDHNANKVTMDNIRRILSGYFAWLEDEDYIMKSPARRIHKVKSAQIIKETFTDENLEALRDCCEDIRELSLYLQVLNDQSHVIWSELVHVW